MTELQIIEGRKYVTRGGEVVGPMVRETRKYREGFKWTTPALESPWMDDGRYMDDARGPYPLDIVSEFIEPTTQEAGPVTKDVLRTPRMIIEWLPDGTVYIRSYGTSGADDLRETALALLDRANELEQDAKP